MSREECTPYRENLAAYALGALDMEDVQALETHLQRCAGCRAELADYRAIGEGLLAALPRRDPPAGLKRRLAARLRGSGARRSGFSMWWSRVVGRVAWGQVATAVAFVLLVAANLLSLVQMRELQHQQAVLVERVESEQVAIAMLAYPGIQSVPVRPDIEGVAGQMLVDPDGRIATLILWNMPRPRQGEVYQAWLIDEQGGRVSGGLFTPQEEGTFTVVVVAAPDPLEKFTGLGVTVEPQGGSPAPTGPRLLSVDF
ncbi:MAG: hypothetical protein D6770_09345 [Anaerolineae bacterium]|nr:MAG: hypothetical protein D6770_09345 [Anaerolineae bacterium]